MKALGSSASYFLPELSLIDEKLREIVTNNKSMDVNSCYNCCYGKKVRPALFFICASLFNKEKKQFLPVACALELIHNATLVHDDIIDNSDKRRGMQTINTIFGNQKAVLFGDYLFTEAFKLLVDYGNLEVIKTLSEVVSEMTSGELSQLQDLYNIYIKEEEYLQRVTQKTALFFAACCYLAGVVCNAGEVEKKSLWHFGLNLGIAFQVRDDLLDLMGDEKEIGKEVGNDLKNGVVTLPLIFALKDLSFKNKYEALIEKQELSLDNNISNMRKDIKNIGGESYSQKIAERYYRQALKELNLLPSNAEKVFLKEVANHIMHRKS